jgi:hypothetical protein
VDSDTDIFVVVVRGGPVSPCRCPSGQNFDDRKVVDMVERGLLGPSRAGLAAHRSGYGASSHKVNPTQDHQQWFTGKIS